MVFLALALVAALAVRSLWRNRKRHCNGDCASCGGCHGHKIPETRRE